MLTWAPKCGSTSLRRHGPVLQYDVNAYTPGSTATLNIPVSYANPYGGAYIDVTGANLRMDWTATILTQEAFHLLIHEDLPELARKRSS